MEQLIIDLAAATTIRSLYPAGHPRLLVSIMAIIETLQRALKARGSDSVTILVVGDDLVIDQDVLRRGTLSQQQLIDVLKRRGIERLTLAAGVEPDEIDHLLLGLSAGEALQSSAHVIVGRVQISVQEEEDSRKGERRELSVDQLEIVREAFVNFRSGKPLPMEDIEQLIWGFIDSMSRNTRSILPLAKLKEHDEYTFVHCVNVSLLVIGQARSFGITDRMLHTFGMAALLHDIGKMMVPLNVLNSPGKLEGDQWAMMQSHAEKGAWYLTGHEGVPPLSILVAFEHHLRFDGKPNYPVLKRPRRPNLISRMTSIADAFDAMQTVRPYQKPMMRSAAIDIISRRAETFYDPMLVASFKQLLETLPPTTVEG